MVQHGGLRGRTGLDPGGCPAILLGSACARLQTTWTFSIQKYFPIKESVRLQFRLDMFNAFNHTNFYSPNTIYRDRDLGPSIKPGRQG